MNASETHADPVSASAERRATLQSLCAQAQERIDHIAPAAATIKAMYMAATDTAQANALLTEFVTMERVLHEVRVQLMDDERALARVDAWVAA